MNHYQLLGISQNAGLAEIKQAYKKLAFVHHPDKNFGNEEAEETFKRINEAYKTLSNLRQRKRYDDKMGFNKQPAHEVKYTYHEGGLYRSMMDAKVFQAKPYAKPAVFQSRKRDIDFYLFWLTLGLILILVAVFIFKL